MEGGPSRTRRGIGRPTTAGQGRNEHERRRPNQTTNGDDGRNRRMAVDSGRDDTFLAAVWDYDCRIDGTNNDFCFISILLPSPTTGRTPTTATRGSRFGNDERRTPLLTRRGNGRSSLIIGTMKIFFLEGGGYVTPLRHLCVGACAETHTPARVCIRVGVSTYVWRCMCGRDLLVIVIRDALARPASNNTFLCSWCDRYICMHNGTLTQSCELAWLIDVRGAVH